MNITPILWIKGRVRQVQERAVPAYPGRVGGYDQTTGKTVSPQPARPAYTMTDVAIDTDPGGIITLSITAAALAALGGEIPAIGDTVEVPVRAMDVWMGPDSRRYVVKGYSMAHDVQGAYVPVPTSSGTRALSNAS